MSVHELFDPADARPKRRGILEMTRVLLDGYCEAGLLLWTDRLPKRLAGALGPVRHPFEMASKLRSLFGGQIVQRRARAHPV